MMKKVGGRKREGIKWTSRVSLVCLQALSTFSAAFSAFVQLCNGASLSAITISDSYRSYEV